MAQCPVCLHHSIAGEEFVRNDNDQMNVNCPRCGNFSFTRSTTGMLNNRLQERDDLRWALSHWIRRSQKSGYPIEINTNLFRKLVEDLRLPKPREQAENLIIWLGESLKYPEDSITSNPFCIAAVVGTKNSEGVRYIALHLREEGYIQFTEFEDPSSKKAVCALTFKGWDKYEELKRSGGEGKIAFMAMQYDNPEHDKIYEDFFKNAVAKTGFQLRRLDENLSAGLIDNQLRVEIRKSRMLLADLTNDNNGAYWEAGYAEGLGKPVIYLCEKEHFEKFKTHFDTNHHTTIIWDKNDLLPAIEQLKATIRATLPAEAKIIDE